MITIARALSGMPCPVQTPVHSVYSCIKGSMYACIKGSMYACINGPIQVISITTCYIGPDPGSGGWMRVSTPLELRPGDIIVWLKPDSSDANSTGHIMIVAGDPIENPKRTGEVLVPVIDSTKSIHSSDTRSPGQTGLGKGIIGIMTDSSGLPTGYYWRGGKSRTFHETEMVFARIA